MNPGMPQDSPRGSLVSLSRAQTWTAPQTFSGQPRHGSATVTGAYTVASNVDTVLANAAGGPFTVTLPSASANAGRRITVVKTDSSLNNLTVASAGGAVNGPATVGTQWQAKEWESNGTDWYPR